MKALSILLMLTLVGCLKPVPPEPPKPTIVEVRILPPTVVKGVVIEVIPDPEPPVSTWMTGEELRKLQEERHRKAVQDGLECDEGDPLCEVVP